MPYASQQDLIDRFGELEIIQLTDRDNVPPEAIGTDVVDRALADADALIDSYLAAHYALPLSSAPPSLVKAAADIARFYLWGDRADPKGAIRAAHDDAVRWLERLSKGLVSLEIDGASPPPAPTGDARVSGSTPVFSRDSLRGTI